MTDRNGPRQVDPPSPPQLLAVEELTLQLSRAEWAALEAAAGRRNMTVGRLIRSGVADWLGRERGQQAGD